MLNWCGLLMGMIPLFLYNWLSIQVLFFILVFFSLFNCGYFFTQWFIVSSYFSFDVLSLSLVILSIWILALMFLASVKVKFMYNWYVFGLVNLLMMMALLLTFCVSDIMMLYIGFEFTLIPIFLLILGWGYQPERLQAGIYLLFYTIFASLPLLFIVFYIYEMMLSSNVLVLFYGFSFFDCSYLIDSFFLMCMCAAFLVKLPLFGFHLWLPKAHVEAPIAGSMILAGLLLKLGGYGLFRFFLCVKNINFIFSSSLISLSLIGGVLVSLICLRQTDAKSLVAYSSIAHMGLMLSGMMTFFFWGSYGALIMMVAHGLSSSGLFCLVNIVYDRLSSRSLFMVGGLLNIFPLFALWGFLLISTNMAAPPSINLMSEISLFNSLVGVTFSCIVILIFFFFFSAVYSLFFFVSMIHGQGLMSFKNFKMFLFREQLLSLLHWLPINLLILKVDLLFNWL